MDWDEPKAPRTVTIGEDLSTLSVGELEARISALEAEVDRVRAEIKTKKARAAAADRLFKS
jgi:uncharacterized small protein (DUF1192 family)